jgi:ABC-type sugar transport system ATPase subunit
VADLGSRRDGLAVTLALELRNVSVAFGATVALSDVTFELLAGEVHVLAGENGAGKSTLIRVIAGAERGYTGELRVRGRAVRFAGPADAVRTGIATIHQELSLVPSLTVAENLALGAPGSSFGVVNVRAVKEAARVALGRVELDLDPDAPVERLTLGERQLVEIARALAREASVLVMDEPTSALSESEAARLFVRLDELVRRGTSIVYISHRLHEIERVASRVTVLRDGRRVFTKPAAELGREALVTAMLGRAVSLRAFAGTPTPKKPKLRVAARFPAAVSPSGSVAFEVGEGEIVGLAGARGSGTSELLRALGGDLPGLLAGTTLDGRAYAPVTPRAALAEGVAYVAADRTDSVLSNLGVRDNAMLSRPGDAAHEFVDRRAERQRLDPETRRLRVKAADLDVEVGSLSGGNQQKVALLRALFATPRVLLLDDPARGVDLGARADLYERLHQAAKEGMSVLFASSDLTELVEHADRVLVLFRGTLIAEVPRAELEEDRLLTLSMGGAA